MLLLRSFDPHSRIIQLVHIFCSCLTRRTRDLVLLQVCIELNFQCPHIFGTDAFSDEVVSWIHHNHPEAYLYATSVIGFCSPWITTVDEVELILSQKPYLYQGRIEFVKELNHNPPYTPHSAPPHTRNRNFSNQAHC